MVPNALWVGLVFAVLGALVYGNSTTHAGSIMGALMAMVGAVVILSSAWHEHVVKRDRRADL